jgi:hypothetical protein
MEQLNVRLPDELARAVRVRAAELGVKPRDVVVEALEAFGLTQVPSKETEAPPRADDSVRPTRRRTNKGTRGSTARPQGRVARAKAGEAGTSGGRPDPGRKSSPAASQSACPECAGELQTTDDGTMVVCGDCGFRAGRLPGV